MNMSKDRFILKTVNEAKEYFNINNNSKSYMFIKFLYKLSQDNKLPAPFVAKYGSKFSYACRRWVETRNEVNEYINKHNIDLTNLFKKYKFYGFHDTTLEKINAFPNASDYENLIAISINLKTTFNTDYVNAIRYTLFGEVKTLSIEDNKVFEIYINYYNNNSLYINNLANNFNAMPGEIFRKCKNKEVKNDITNNWKIYGNYSKYPNYTPKTDLISNYGTKLSIKKANGAQAMSGNMYESGATLRLYKHLLSKPYQDEIENIFTKEWIPEDDANIKRIDNLIKKIMTNEDNIEYVIAILTESITGCGKFGHNSIATPNKIISWTKEDIIEDDIITYIFRVFQTFKETSITINHKSSNNEWVCMRIYLPNHKEAYKPITQKELKDNARVIKVINKIINGQ